MGSEEGELALEVGEVPAFGGGAAYGRCYGRGELVDPDALTYIVRDTLPDSSYRILPPSSLPCRCCPPIGCLVT
jgi:hypothetical protein